jgi:hypothetical protein
MPPRLSKRQQREQEELLALSVSHDLKPDSPGTESQLEVLGTPQVYHAASGFAAVRCALRGFLQIISTHRLCVGQGS